VNKIKAITLILIFFIVVCLGLGSFGYYHSTTNTSKNSNNDNDSNDKYKINMIYYLNSTQKLSDIPTNTEEETLYKFEKYVCTNKVKGIWNEEDWKFDVDKTADATCKLYFISAIYNTTINVTNGILDPSAITKVDSNSDGVFKITANEGYTFDKVTCANEEEVLWDETKSELTVKKIKSDTTCDVSFKLKEYSVEISVTNGRGAITKTIQHNQTFSSSVTATSGYGNPTITCNNTDLGQSAAPGTWANDTYTMNSVTSNLKCVIEFKLIEVTPVKYTVTIEIVPSDRGSVDNNSLSVNDGESVVFNVNVVEGYKIGSLTECKGAVNNENNTITISNVRQNLKCRIYMDIK
jgi:hypothetical protein